MKSLSRRAFIAAGAAAAGTATTFATRESARADNNNSTADYGGFRVGIQSNILHNFSPEPEAILGHIAALGLRQVEFIGSRHYPVTLDEERISYMQDLLARHEMTMEAYFVGDMPADKDNLRKTFEFARKNGVSVLVGMPTEEALPILDSLVKEFEIKVAMHNYGPGARYDLVEHLIIAAAPWDWRIGYCLDTGHTMRSGEDPVAAVRRLGSRLYGMHLREHSAISRDPQPPETIVGEGALDLEALCVSMRDVGFSGPLTIEVYFNRRDPIDSLKQSLANFAQAARDTK